MSTHDVQGTSAPKFGQSQDLYGGVPASIYETDEILNKYYGPNGLMAQMHKWSQPPDSYTPSAEAIASRQTPPVSSPV